MFRIGFTYFTFEVDMPSDCPVLHRLFVVKRNQAYIYDGIDYSSIRYPLNEKGGVRSSLMSSTC